MNTPYIDGHDIAKTILNTVKRRVQKLKHRGTTPLLAVVLVGDDKPSHTYVRRKGDTATSVGIDFALHTFPYSITTHELISAIEHIQHNSQLSGIIVQLPLPKHIDSTAVINTIRPDLDVDCLTDVNLGKLVMQTQTLIPPTPGAVFAILKHLNVDISGKNITLVGTGQLVGRPLSLALVNTKASVTTCNEKTKDIKEKCRHADIIVTGVGKRNIIRGDMVSKNAIVIDTGVSFYKKKMYGDVAWDEVRKKTRYLTPTPGGVGPITVAELLLNTVICAEEKITK